MIFVLQGRWCTFRFHVMLPSACSIYQLGRWCRHSSFSFFWGQLTSDQWPLSLFKGYMDVIQFYHHNWFYTMQVNAGICLLKHVNSISFRYLKHALLVINRSTIAGVPGLIDIDCPRLRKQSKTGLTRFIKAKGNRTSCLGHTPENVDI